MKGKEKQRRLSCERTAVFNRYVKIGCIGGLFSLSTIVSYAASSTADENVVKAVIETQQSKKRISGTVLDASGLSVIGANVVEQGTMNGVITDVDGKFVLSVASNAKLEISFIGYKTQVVSMAGKSSIEVVLKEDSELLDEVVVVGFGTQKKVNLTGSVAVVDSEALESRPVSDAASLLQGTVPGLNITNSGGTDLDAGTSINIRGVGTIGSGSKGEPLLLIDGMEGDFNSLNPQDIESISVLKDAAASSIYGSRAPFGVILITTKSGKSGKLSVNYNNSFRFASPRNLPKMIDSYSFANFINEADANAGKGAWFDEKEIADIVAFQRGERKEGQYISPTDPNFWGDGYAYGVANTDHYDDAYVSSAFSHVHNVSVSGGTEKLNVFLSANYADETGFIELNPDKIRRFTNSVKINAQIFDWLKLKYSSRYSLKDYNYPTNLKKQEYAWANNQPSFFKGLAIWPTMPNFDPNGNPYASMTRGVGNAVFSLLGGDSQEKKNDLFQQIQLEIEPIKGWKTFIDYNFRFSDSETTAQLKKTYNTGVDNKTLYPVCVDSYVEEFRYSGRYNNLNLYSEYAKTFNEKHSMKTMIGFQTENSKYGNVSLRRDGLIVPELISINTTNGLTSVGSIAPPLVSGAYNDWATAGFFGRVNYDYAGKYLLEANLRYDGTSRFKGDYQWGLFPSGSVGWNIAREEFFEPLVDHVSTLKLRASYGELGNQNTNQLYPTYRLMSLKTSAGEYLINGSRPTTTTEPGLIDPSLTWERIVNWNVGLDVSALSGRLNFTADYFVRNTIDMVGPAIELPALLGIGVPKQNNTSLSTKGYELALSWRDMLDNGFSYGVSATLSDAITTIDEYSNPTGSLSTYIAGREIGEIWGYETVGIAKSKEEMTAHLAHSAQSQLGGAWDAGDVMYRDLNGDGKVNNGSFTIDNHGDLKVIGNSTPRYAFSFTLDAAYKGFDLKAFFQGVLKRDMWLGGPAGENRGAYFWGVGNSMWGDAMMEEHLDYFRADADNPLGQNLDSYYPRPIHSKPGARKNQQIQTRYLQNGAYTRLKNLQIGYTLPSSLASKLNISNCRIFVSAENLFTISTLSNTFDPETLSGGYFGSSYPLAKTISTGLSLTF